MKGWRIVVLLLLLGSFSQAATAPVSFQAIDAEPLGTVPEKAIVLHAGWQIKDAD